MVQLAPPVPRDWNAIIDKNAPHGTSPMVDQADPMGLGGVS
jgi:hypothetical protein